MSELSQAASRRGTSLVLVLGIVLVVGALASGCGGSDDESGSGSSPPPTMTETGGDETGEETGGSGATAAGRMVFEENCASCHVLADAGAAGQVGPDLDELAPDRETTESQVRNGGGGMPAFEGALSDPEIESVASYVASVAGA